MHPRIIIRFLAWVILFLGGAMALPLAVSVIYRDGSSGALLLSMSLTVLMGLALFFSGRRPIDTHLSHRDGVAIVTIGWILAGLVGTFPFIFSGVLPNFTNAFFESLSGFTTTGASTISNVEGLPEGILLWRSLIQWLGGMGIILLSIAILPFLGVGGMQLYKAEVPSPVVDKLKPRISETAKTLWKVYLLITALQIVLLLAGGMSFLDAVCHAFCTMPTGGFSTKNASISHFNSVYIESVILIFMLLAGINFALHYKLLRGDLKVFGRDPECRVFIMIVGVLVLLVTFDIYGNVYDSIGTAFRYAAFQVGSNITTTGFVTADYDKWPALSQLVLITCMFLGGMAGSTGGGIKIMRVMVLVKHSYQQIFHIIHPHAVTTVKLGGKSVPQEILNGIWGFFILYLGLFVVAAFTMAAMGMDLISAFSSVAACIGNIGPGLGLVGPATNYLSVPETGKWILIFCMLLGRLEIYTVILLLTPEYWRK